MSARRESVDLFTKRGLRTFFRYLFKYRQFNRLVWRDTFGRVLCWLSGEHVIRQDFENGQCETSCTCCCKWLVQDGYKWYVRRV